MRFDQKDRKILEILLRTATTPKAEIARAVGIAPTAIAERIKRLEATGVIRGYETRLDPRTLGFGVLAYIFVTERKPTGGVPTGELLAGVVGVEEVHKIAGEDCFLVKVRARDTDALAQTLEREINAIESVAGTRTTIVLRTIKEGMALDGVDFAIGPSDERPLSAPAEVRRGRERHGPSQRASSERR
jgi:Lrp/AsnC family leucine-responsive transcriptional regulator